MSNHNLVKIKWSDSVWFFDIDDTLIDTAGTTIEASEGIREVLKETFSDKKAKEVQKNFNEIFNLVLAGYRVKKEEDWLEVPGGKKAFDELFLRVGSCQESIKKKYGAVKKWSREVFIKIVADRAGIKVSP